MSTTLAPASATEALDMLESAMRHLTAVDPTEIPAAIQGECLQRLERFHAIETAARARILGRSPPSGPSARTRITVPGRG